MRPLRYLTLTSCLALALLPLSGCDGNEEEKLRTTVTLGNVAGGPVHILAPGESPDPSNQLGFFGTRDVQISYELFDSITFRAVRNGQEITQVNCLADEEYGEAPGADEAPNVTFSFADAAKLECSNW